MAFDLTTAIISDLAGRVFASSLGSLASCAGGTADLLVRSRRPNIPVAARVPSSDSVGAWAQPSWAKAEHRRSEGSLPSGADHRATPLYAVGPRGLTMMQSCASAAKLR